MVSKVNKDYVRFNSWGRTRQPKNLAGENGSQVLAPTAEPAGATAGYITENQRFLHLLLDTDEDGSNVKIVVWAYSHAFGAWGTLTGVGGAAEITANDAKKHQVFEISGVDRVYFQSIVDNLAGIVALDGKDKLFAAGTTF